MYGGAAAGGDANEVDDKFDAADDDDDDDDDNCGYIAETYLYRATTELDDDMPFENAANAHTRSVCEMCVRNVSVR